MNRRPGPIRYMSTDILSEILTIIPTAARTPRVTRRTARRNWSRLPRAVTASRASSKRNGTARAIAKGQPIIPPAANQAIPAAVLNPPVQSMKAAAPNMPVYMAKLEGRYAVLAWKFPGLRIKARMKKTPMRGWTVRLITR